jgi:DNA polymerase delta subunit 1
LQLVCRFIFWLHHTLFTLERLLDVLAFQQLEIDYIIGESHKGLLPNSSGPAAILRSFGVTKEGVCFFLRELSSVTWPFLTFDVILFSLLGHSICCQLHGFEPYFYIGCPSGMGPDDISRFHQTLEVCT